MKRRDSLKALGLTSLSGLNVLKAEIPAAPIPADTPVVVPEGRTKAEAVRDAALMKNKFFTEHEMHTLRLLTDLLIPADSRSGSASQAKVPEFIEFMMKDQPEHQTPMRGGLRWLDSQCRKRFGKPFISAIPAQQSEMLDAIAYPQLAKPEMSQGVAFFTFLRDLTATGFFTSQMGIKDLGYLGNTANNWQGVPPDVLEQYGLSYDE